MKRIIQAIITWLLKPLYGRRSMYSFFYFLYLQALRGMDHGYGYKYPETSGEFQVLKNIARCYENHGQIVIFDVGANKGLYANEVSRILGDKALIYCFEPSLFTYEELLRNVPSNLKTFQLALSDERGEKILRYDEPGSGTASLEDTSYAPPFGIISDKQERVAVDTIDHFVSSHSIGKVHLLKMDVEGHELQTLRGAIVQLQTNPFDFIQFEFGRTNVDSGQHLKDFYKLLEDRYYIYRIIESGLIRQFTYNYEYEIYLGTNFLAVRRDMAESDQFLSRLEHWN
jgi:FkbM family methyltransferase